MPIRCNFPEVLQWKLDQENNPGVHLYMQDRNPNDPMPVFLYYNGPWRGFIKATAILMLEKEPVKIEVFLNGDKVEYHLDRGEKPVLRGTGATAFY